MSGDEDKPKLSANFKRKNENKEESLMEKFSKSWEAYKSILMDKILPKNRTAAYDKNVRDIINRLLVSADKLDEQNPGEGIFGLIAALLSSNLTLKDRNNELEVRVRELELKVKRLEKQ
jgi:hypothetical protein